MKNFEKIEYNGEMYAIIIRNSYTNEGANFFSDNDSPQQLAYMKHPKGKVLDAHVHNRVAREISITQEFLYIKKGKLRVDFYHADHTYTGESRVLEKDDLILLSGGGHGFECLEEVEMIDIKQGPYLGDKDKVRFLGVNQQTANIKD